MSSFGYNCRLRHFGWSHDQPFFCLQQNKLGAEAAITGVSSSKIRPIAGLGHPRFKLKHRVSLDRNIKGSLDLVTIGYRGGVIVVNFESGPRLVKLDFMHATVAGEGIPAER